MQEDMKKARTTSFMVTQLNISQLAREFSTGLTGLFHPYKTEWWRTIGQS